MDYLLRITIASLVLNMKVVLPRVHITSAASSTSIISGMGDEIY